MQLEEQGTCALPPSAVHQLFCRNPDWRLASDHTRTAQKAQAQGLDLGGASRGASVSHSYKKPLLGARLLNCTYTNTNNQPQQLQLQDTFQNNTFKPPYHQQINQYGRLRKLWLLLRQLLLRSRRLLLQRKITSTDSCFLLAVYLYLTLTICRNKLFTNTMA
jgi:hypothetical protein